MKILFALTIAVGALASAGEASTTGTDRVSETKTFAGVPVLVTRAAQVKPDTRLVVLFHGFGPPASPEALSQVLPLEKLDVVLAYVNLPLVAGRMPAGGKDELRRLQMANFVNGLFFRSINGAAGELPRVVHELAGAYHLRIDRGIGLFGFSAGGAAAMLALMESELPIKAAVIVNAPMSVTQNVANWERLLKKHFEWDPESRKAAERYDVPAHADAIAGRKLRPALLLMEGEADESFSVDTARRATEALKIRYAARGPGAPVEFEEIRGLEHNFGPIPGAKASAHPRVDQEIAEKTQDWFERFLPRDSS